MGIKKQYLKSRPVCKVTFSIPKERGNSSKKACVAGEFNDWSLSSHPMKKKKDGTFYTTIDLEKGRTYQFRYVLDDDVWINEADADSFATTHFGDSENSVLIV